MTRFNGSLTASHISILSIILKGSVFQRRAIVSTNKISRVYARVSGRRLAGPPSVASNGLCETFLCRLPEISWLKRRGDLIGDFTLLSIIDILRAGAADTAIYLLAPCRLCGHTHTHTHTHNTLNAFLMCRSLRNIWNMEYSTTHSVDNTQ